MDYTSDSDVSEGTRDLVRQGLASVKRKRLTLTSYPERVHERLSTISMDTSNIRHPLSHEGTNGVSSTHGQNVAGREIATGQNHNNIISVSSLDRKSDDNNPLSNRVAKNGNITYVIGGDFNRSYAFKEVHNNNMHSFYNVCIEGKTPPLKQNSSKGQFIETQRIVIYIVGGSSGQRGDVRTFERRNISVAGSARSSWNHWELYFTDASIPSTHTFLPTTVFFVFENTPDNLYHAWNGLFRQLFSVVRDASRLHPGMRNQIVYNSPRSNRNLLDVPCKFCRRSPYDFLQHTLNSTNEYFLFYELPTNTCYSSAAFGTGYSDRNAR